MQNDETPQRSFRLQRSNLSEELQAEIRRRIVEGDLAPGERINEVALAARLEVSRTPLREALARLVAEGFVRSIPRRGFFVAELSAAEAREIYPIRQLLDPEALRLTGLPEVERLAELDELNQRLATESRVEKRLELDDRWHLLLIADCPNGTLLDLIRQFMRKTRRYELAYFASGRHVSVATEEHRRILRRLREGDLDGARDALRVNLSSAVSPLVAWLEPTQESPSRQGDSP